MLNKYFSIFLCLIQNAHFNPKNKAVHLLKQKPQSIIMNCGLLANMYTKQKRLTKIYFSQNLRQLYIITPYYHRHRSFTFFPPLVLEWESLSDCVFC